MRKFISIQFTTYFPPFLHSEFCGTKNEDLNVDAEEIPKGDCFDFILEPAPQNQEATEEIVKEAKKEISSGVTVYCMDVSSSMDMQCSIPEFQGETVLQIS